MEKKMIMNYKKRFDEIRHEENGVEFWYARELMHLLDYSKWQNFENVLLKAKVACANNGIVVEDHFADASKMVILGSGANREVEDYMLTRYACYLIAENGDPRKEQIAFAQSYFAVQTRKQELIEERISYIERTEARGKLRESEKRLSQNIYERGVDDAGFGRMRSCTTLTSTRQRTSNPALTAAPAKSKRKASPIPSANITGLTRRTILSAMSPGGAAGGSCPS